MNVKKEENNMIDKLRTSAPDKITKIADPNYELLQKIITEKTEVIKMVADSINGGLKGSIDDENYTYFYVNEGLPKMLGYTYEEFMEMSGGSAVGAVYPPDLAGALEECERCFERSASYSAEYRMLKKDGTLMWVMDSGRKTKNDKGEILINSFIMDITPLKTALSDLKIERERYKIALQNITEVMFEYDLVKDVFVSFDKTASDKGETMDRFEIYHFKHFLSNDNFVHPDDRDALWLHCSGKNNQKIRVRMNEYYKKNKQPLWCWKEIQCKVIFDVNDEAVRTIGTIRDISEEQKREQSLIDRANQDSLTGLLNQRAVREAVERYQIKKNSSENAVLLMLDLDNFKIINDTKGHLFGNAILISISDILKEICGIDALISRVGGDEFLIFLKNTNQEEASFKANEIICKIKALYDNDDDLTRDFSCSIGIAFTSKKEDTYDLLFRRADIALYEVKKNGKSNFLFYKDIEQDNNTIDEVIRVISDNESGNVYKSISRHIEHLTKHDQLTNLPNFTKFREEAHIILKENKDKKYALIYTDFKNFKYFNEQFGYEQGDAVLKELALRLQGKNRKSVVAARMMADHFLTLIPVEEGGKGNLIKYIRKFMAQFCDDMNKRFIGANLILRTGIYILEADCKSLTVAVDRANIAKNAITESARTNNCRLYNDRLAEKISWENELGNTMTTALKNKEFIVYFQPKINLQNELVVGAEALVRWKKPNGEIIMPNQFIPFFEKNGFILELDNYVIDCVLEKMRQWKEEGRPMIPISINISRVHAEYKYSIKKLVQKVINAGISVEYMEFELTETAFVNKPESVINMMKAMQSEGFLTSVDDFGSGYSMLSFMSRMPANTIKIDRSFIINCEKTEKGRSFLKQIIQIIKSMDYTVLCEGVETKEQMEMLRDFGCDIVQGYYYGHPMPYDIFGEYMEKHKKEFN
ncbi:MAG: EAL domain-containing protein [Eubacterium sp.]